MTQCNDNLSYAHAHTHMHLHRGSHTHIPDKLECKHNRSLSLQIKATVQTATILSQNADVYCFWQACFSNLSYNGWKV